MATNYANAVSMLEQAKRRYKKEPDESNMESVRFWQTEVDTCPPSPPMAKPIRKARKPRKTPKPNGAVIYRGPSMIDGSPIVAIVTGINDKSSNEKTGGMLQTWILRADIAPHEAIKTGADRAICGDCVHRGVANGKKAVGRTCYVQPFQAPRSIWQCWATGKGYPVVTDAPGIAAIGAGRRVRLGSYGDPMAVPVEVWQAFVSLADGHTGYTHQWKSVPVGSPEQVEWSALVMASTEVEGQAPGWRTFRVMSEVSTRATEVLCPASREGGYKSSCDKCGLCSGNSSKASKSVAIVVHGSAGAKHYVHLLAA